MDHSTRRATTISFVSFSIPTTRTLVVVVKKTKKKKKKYQGRTARLSFLVETPEIGRHACSLRVVVDVAGGVAEEPHPWTGHRLAVVVVVAVAAAAPPSEETQQQHLESLMVREADRMEDSWFGLNRRFLVGRSTFLLRGHSIDGVSALVHKEEQ
jgi:hypothetical protein